MLTRYFYSTNTEKKLRFLRKMRLTSFRLLYQSIKNYSSEIPLPPCDFVPKQYQGPSLDRLKQLHQVVVNPSIQPYYTELLGIHQGYKQWLFDFDGRRYLDLFGGISTVSVGHCHPKITEAVTEQISTLGHLANIYISPKMYEYAERLIATFPGNLKVAFFTNSGTEAVDLAITLARSHTQNFDVIALRNSYHGVNNTVASLSTNSKYKHLPPAPGFHHTMNPNVYNGIWGGKYCRDSPVQTRRNCNCDPSECEAGTKYMEQLTEVYNHHIVRNRVAAFFAEPIQGIGGVVQYPKNYLKKAYEAIKEHGGLFIADEVQTGFGRTGDHFWGFQMHGIMPDMVIMAKGIGNGFPLAAIVTTPEIAKAKAAYFNTFGGNPVASAAGIAVLDIIEGEKLQQNCKVIGTYILEQLAELRNQFPVIGDVRGKGLMIGVELVAGDGTTTPMEDSKFVKYWDRCRDLGLLLGRGGYSLNVLRIKPPMCITKEDADFAIAVMKKAFHELF